MKTKVKKEKSKGYKLVTNKKEINILDSMFEIENELENYKKTGTPRCSICKVNYIKESKYVWKPNCKHNKFLRLSIG